MINNAGRMLNGAETVFNHIYRGDKEILRTTKKVYENGRLVKQISSFADRAPSYTEVRTVGDAGVVTTTACFNGKPVQAVVSVPIPGTEEYNHTRYLINKYTLPEMASWRGKMLDRFM